jgi:hypothetical protein
MWKLARLLWCCSVLLLLLPIPPVLAQAPQSIRVRVIAAQLNVRAAPSAVAPVLGILRRGALIDASGVSEDKAWLYFLYWGKPAWLSAAYVEPVNNEPVKDSAVKLLQYNIEPSVPAPGQDFVVNLTIQSERDLAAFKVAASCADFALLYVPRLAANVAQVQALHCPGETATGPHKAEVILDTERSVSSGTNATVSYWIDRPYTQVKLSWPAFSDLNLDGDAYDIAYDGANIQGLNGTRLWPLPDIDLSTIHYDMLVPALQTYTEAPPNGVLGLSTASGSRGALQIYESQLDSLRIEFRVYQ